MTHTFGLLIQRVEGYVGFLKSASPDVYTPARHASAGFLIWAAAGSFGWDSASLVRWREQGCGYPHPVLDNSIS